MPLHNLLAWERGGRRVLVDRPHKLPFMRVTIDTYGIARVERLEGRPPCSLDRADRLAFAILEVAKSPTATAWFKVGLAIKRV